MVNDAGGKGDSRSGTVTVKRSTLLLIAGLTAAVTAVAVVTVVAFANRDSDDKNDQQASTAARQSSSAPQQSTAVSATSPPGAAVSGPLPDAFGPPVTDVFGRRVDVPKNPAGQVLPQRGGQKKPSDPDWLTAAPAGTKDLGGWQRVYGVSVPFSTSDGPTRVEDGVALGFSHTPQGAALAMMQIYYRQAARPADDTVRNRQFILSAEDKATIARSKSEGKLPERISEEAAKYLVAPDAFRVTRFSSDVALIRIAGRGPNSTWFTVEHEMVWVGGDWRWKPPPGSAKTPSSTVTSLEGWTSW